MKSGGPFDLAGRIALVTGGGSGIGRGITAALLAAGAARVYIASRRADLLERAAAELDDTGRCVPITADLSQVAGVRALAEEMRARESQLQILINKSGMAWAAPFDEYPERGWDKTFQLNLKTPFFLVQALADLLAAGGSTEAPSAVINIGSIAGSIDKGGGAFAYGLSKGALHHATRMLALELGPRHVTVNTIAPGRFETGMTTQIVSEPSRYARETAMIPLGRWGDPMELGPAAVFLSSRAAAYITGSTLVVDGGLSLQHPLDLGLE